MPSGFPLFLSLCLSVSPPTLFLTLRLLEGGDRRGSSHRCKVIDDPLPLDRSVDETAAGTSNPGVGGFSVGPYVARRAMRSNE